MSQVHAQAGTTPRTRAEIKASAAPLVNLAERYKISRATAAEWKGDRASRWVFMHIYTDQSEASSVNFLERLQEAAPMKITTLLTDNGSQFTDRFTSKKRKPTGRHKVDVRCKSLRIEHRLCPPRHPQTNGMVKRFNGRISEVVTQTRFASAAELEATLENYVKTYNHQIPQRALHHLSPVQALKRWHAEKRELFVKRVYNQPGLDGHFRTP